MIIIMSNYAKEQNRAQIILNSEVDNVVQLAGNNTPLNIVNKGICCPHCNIFGAAKSHY
jgi:hypothetical protein